MFIVDQSSIITLKQGVRWVQHFEVLQEETGLPFNFSGTEIYSDLIHERTGEVLYSISSEDSPQTNISIDSQNGTFSFIFDEDETNSFKPGIIKFDIRFIFADQTEDASETMLIRVEERQT